VGMGGSHLGNSVWMDPFMMILLGHSILFILQRTIAQKYSGTVTDLDSPHRKKG
jgi:hypothetical protein